MLLYVAIYIYIYICYICLDDNIINGAFTRRWYSRDRDPDFFAAGNELCLPAPHISLDGNVGS